MENRDTLLSCALDLFASRGYDAVGVQEIVEAAGVTKPTLYHYFGSKQGLLRALLAQYHDELLAALQQAADYHGDLPLTLTQITSAYFQFAQAHPTFYRMLISMWYAPRQSEAFQAVASVDRQQFELIEAMFVQAASNHGNMRGRHRHYATSFMGMINSYIGMFLNGYVTLDDTLMYQAVHQFQHGIYS